MVLVARLYQRLALAARRERLAPYGQPKNALLSLCALFAAYLGSVLLVASSTNASWLTGSLTCSPLVAGRPWITGVG